MSSEADVKPAVKPDNPHQPTNRESRRNRREGIGFASLGFNISVQAECFVSGGEHKVNAID
jgi:hypothetical protein